MDAGKHALDAIATSDDGAWIAAGDHSGVYTVWETSSGTRKMELALTYYPSALAFSPDGKRLAVAPAGEPVMIFDVGSGKKLFALPRVAGGCQAVEFSRDGRRIATADSDTVVRTYDARNGELLARHSDFLLEPLAITFTPDGSRMVAAGGDKVIAVLEVSTGRVIVKTSKLADPVFHLAVSPDGAFVAAVLAHADNLLLPAPVVIAEMASGRTVEEWTPQQRVVGGGWTDAGHLLAATRSDKGLSLWRIR
jgi:dipeptidyl aminopeptidase/acylaminoacyl peptidase